MQSPKLSQVKQAVQTVQCHPGCLCPQAIAWTLQDAKKAGKVWAKLVYYVVSPLLAVAAMCTVFCLLYKGTFAGSAAMIASWVAWPLVTVWTQLKSAMGWLHPGRVWIHVIMLIARESL